MLKKLLIALVLLVAALAGIGFLLPGAWFVERSVVIAAERTRVYEEIATPRAWAEWTAWNRELDSSFQWSYEGPATGLGASMTWVGEKAGRGKLDITAADPGSGIEYDFWFEEGTPRSTGAIRLEDAAGGVRVVWTGTGDVGDKLASKYFAALGVIEAMVGGDYEEGLERLKRRLEAGAR